MRYKKYGIQRSPKDRVKRGIAWLDSVVSRGILPGNWRSMVNVETMKFFAPDEGPLGQLFGNYHTGLYKLRISGGGGSEFGFRTRHRVVGDCTELKSAWKDALRTDKTWTKLGDSMVRVIRGVRFILYWDSARAEQPVQVMYKRGDSVQMFPRGYSSYDSAQRAVRKYFNNV